MKEATCLVANENPNYIYICVRIKVETIFGNRRIPKIHDCGSLVFAFTEKHNDFYSSLYINSIVSIFELYDQHTYLLKA